MGVPKAAGDALALRRSPRAWSGRRPSAWRPSRRSVSRVDAAIVARGRRLGAYMEAQLGREEERRRAEQARDAEAVLMETAAPTDYASGSSSRFPARRSPARAAPGSGLTAGTP